MWWLVGCVAVPWAEPEVEAPAVEAVEPAVLPAHEVFETPEAALAHVLVGTPRIVGFGEYHATVDGPAVASSLARFTELVGRTGFTDLVLETWVVDGSCGGEDVVVAEQIAVETNRPEATEGELARLVRVAKEAGIAPRALTLSCDEHSAIQGEDGIDHGNLLRLLTAKQQAYALEAVGREDVRLGLYGGAVHNDVSPGEGLEDYAYGPAVVAAGGDYLEVDLVVPEMVRGLSIVEGQPWLPLIDKARVGIVVVETGPRSRVWIWPTTE